MEYGWADSAPGRLRSRLPNLNLLPAELLPVPIPWLTAGLVLLAVGLVMLLYALFYMRSYTDLEIAAYRQRLATAQETARQLGLPVDTLGENQVLLPPGTLEDWAELKARQVNWPGLLGAIAGNAPQNVNVTGATQTGYTVSIAGDAGSTGDANTFLQRLRDSGLFASLEMSISGEEPVAQTTVGPGPQAQASPTLGPPNQAIPPQIVPSATPTVAIVFPPPLPTSTPRPPQPLQPTSPPQPPATLAPRTPLATPTPLGAVPTVAATQGALGTPTVAPTNTPAFDFVVQSKRETVDPNAIGNNSAVRVRVIDAAGNLVPGLRARIDSQGDPPWGTDLPREGGAQSNGTFEFPVGMGKFTVYIANGSSERATDLFTGVQGQPGVHVWDVTFRKMIPGTPAAQATCPGCTPTPTPTWTLTPAPTATPISVGRNVAGFACATTSANQGDAFKTVDGDVNSGWDSGQRPVQQLSLDFQRYASLDNARACQPVASGGVTSYMLEAGEFVTQMSGNSKITVELWALYEDNTSALLNTFTDVDAFDNMTLSYRMPTPRAVKTVVLRTLRSNVNVAWREVRLFEPLPPAIGTWTATPVATTTAVATPSTPTPTNPQVFAQSVSASSSSTNNPPGNAVDGDYNSFWRPITSDGAPQLQFNIANAQQVAYVRFTASITDGGTTTPTPTPSSGTPVTTVGAYYQIVLVQAGTALRGQQAGGRTAQDVEVNCGIQHLVTQDNQTIQDQCVSGSSSFAVRVKISGVQGGAFPGVREMSVYGSAVTATATPTITPTATVTATNTSTPLAATRTAMARATLTAVSCLSAGCTATPTPSETPTATPTASPTMTMSPTPSPTTPPGLDAAAGNPLQASANGTDARSSPGNAVDVTGSPPQQNATTYWLADGAATGVTFKRWNFTGLGGIPLSAVQARLYMPTPTSGSITFRYLDSGSNQVGTDYAVSGTWSDMQVVGAGYSSPLPNVDQVQITFSQIAVAPGLRTVGIYRPVTSQDRRGARAFLDVLPASLASITSIFDPPRAHAAPDQQGYPNPPVLATPTPLGPPPAKPGQVGQATVSAVLTARPALTPVPPSAPLTGNPFPSAPLATPAPALQAQPTPLVPGPAPRGRVSFLIIAQVRPGAP